MSCILKKILNALLKFGEWWQIDACMLGRLSERSMKINKSSKGRLSKHSDDCMNMLIQY